MMKTTDSNRINNRLRHAALAAALLAAGGTASADTASLTLEYTCPFPLIGTQPITADITAEVPASAQVGVPIGDVPVDVTTTLNDQARQGLSLVGATTVEGTALSDVNVSVPGGDRPQQVELTIPQTAVPAAGDPFIVPASGTQASLTFNQDDVGNGTITVGALSLDITSRKADGSIAPDPVGQFTIDCTQTAGQDNVLHTFEVAGASPEPDIDVASEPVDFGTVQAGLSAEETITVNNVGGASLGINNVTLSGADADKFMLTNNCTTVAAGSSCSVDVTYFAEGDATHTAQVTIESTDPDEASVTVDLTAQSIPEQEPDIAVDTSAVEFGSVRVGMTQEQTVTVTNQGTAGLTINEVSLQGGDGDLALVSHDCSTVAAGDSCSATLTYTPSASGSDNAELLITSNDPDEASLTVPVSGEGTESTGVQIDLGLEGSTFIASADDSLPLSGQIAAELDLGTNMFEGELNLDPTQGTFEVFRLFRPVNATAHVEFEQLEPTTGTLIDGTLKSTSKMYIEVPKVTVKLFGINWPIGGGDQCRTSEPVTIKLQSPDGEVFKPLEGGEVTGTYNLPPLENCGGLTRVLNHFMAGEGNTIDLMLTPEL
ncbi:choice-of-anchor D domain-containing protein [Marinobacteraceae bacterium S3BR75-40.1]